jgi:hypothetical protein
MSESTTPDRRSAYAIALSEAADDADDALSHIRAEYDAGRITAREAADERVRLLENHLERLARLRAEHLGGES